MSGYTYCTCRDCPDTAIGGLCWECEGAECEPLPDQPFPGMLSMFDCQREDAYSE